MLSSEQRPKAFSQKRQAIGEGARPRCCLENSIRRLTNMNTKPSGKLRDRDAVQRTALKGIQTVTSGPQGRFKTAMSSGEQHSKFFYQDHQAIGEGSRPRCCPANCARRLSNMNMKPFGKCEDRDTVRRRASEGFLTGYSQT